MGENPFEASGTSSHLDSASRPLARFGGAIPRDKFLETFLQRGLRAVAEELSSF